MGIVYCEEHSGVEEITTIPSAKKPRTIPLEGKIASLHLWQRIESDIDDLSTLLAHTIPAIVDGGEQAQPTYYAGYLQALEPYYHHPELQQNDPAVPRVLFFRAALGYAVQMNSFSTHTQRVAPPSEYVESKLHAMNGFQSGYQHGVRWARELLSLPPPADEGGLSRAWIRYLQEVAEARTTPSSAVMEAVLGKPYVARP
jgi:hypothetical protein